MGRMKLLSRSLVTEPSPDPCASVVRALRLRFGLPLERRPTNAEAEHARRELIADLGTHPLRADRQRALVAIDQAAPNERYRPRAVADVLADRMTVCLRLLMQRAVVFWSCTGPESGVSEQELTPRAVVELVVDMLAAVPYLWVAGLTQKVVVEARVPPHTIGQALTPFSLMWWAYEVWQNAEAGAFEWAVGHKLYRSFNGEIQGLSLGIELPPPAGDEELISLVEGRVLYGQRFPDDIVADARRGTEQMLSELSFLNSPYVPKIARSLPRAERRRLSHAGVTLDSGEVHFIDLRSARGEEDDSPERSPKSRYHGRWIVHGHHRAQWFPSLRSHRLIWIPPYVKGPGGGPPMPRAYRVIR